MQTYNHGNRGTAVNACGLTIKEAEKLYSTLCEKFWKVENHITVWNGKIQGFFLCK